MLVSIRVEQGEGGQAAKEVQFELRETLALFHGDPSADVGAVIATVLEEALLGARGVDLASRPLHFILWVLSPTPQPSTLDPQGSRRRERVRAPEKDIVDF